jgi:hypothetical protein
MAVLFGFPTSIALHTGQAVEFDGRGEEYVAVYA